MLLVTLSGMTQSENCYSCNCSSLNGAYVLSQGYLSTLSGYPEFSPNSESCSYYYIFPSPLCERIDYEWPIGYWNCKYQYIGAYFQKDEGLDWTFKAYLGYCGVGLNPMATGHRWETSHSGNCLEIDQDVPLVWDGGTHTNCHDACHGGQLHVTAAIA